MKSGAFWMRFRGALWVACRAGGRGRPRFLFSSRSRHTSSLRDWSSDVCSSDLGDGIESRRAVDPAFSAESVMDIVLDLVRHALTECVQIGRASCRERMENAVDALSLDK